MKPQIFVNRWNSHDEEINVVYQCEGNRMTSGVFASGRRCGNGRRYQSLPIREKYEAAARAFLRPLEPRQFLSLPSKSID